MSDLDRALARAGQPPIVPLSGWSAALATLVAAAMSFLAVLAVAAGLAADRLAEGWRGNLDGEATVTVSAPRDRLAQVSERALAVLATTDGVARARLLSDAEHEALLAPWLGEEVALDELPAPRLIAVRETGGGPDRARLQERLDTAAPGAVYDDHDAWRRPLIAAADRLQWLAWAGVGLIAVAAAATVWIAVRATLAGHAEIIRTVRLIGGEDRYVAGAFLRRLALRGLAGGLVGAASAGLLLQGLPAAQAGTAAEIALLPEPALWAAIVLGVALGTALVAWAAAALSVRLLLAALP